MHLNLGMSEKKKSGIFEKANCSQSFEDFKVKIFQTFLFNAFNFLSLKLLFPNQFYLKCYDYYYCVTRV